MRYTIRGLMLVGVLLLLGTTAFAQPAQPQKLSDVVAKGCDQEIKTFCSNVTQGEGRILACLYAYEDKLSSRCEYALYEPRTGSNMR